MQSGPYIFEHGRNLYYFNCCPNIFKLELYNEHGLKVHTLIFNLRLFPSQLEERLRNYSYLPPFQGTISNWTVDSKAISWTDVGYSFIISTSVKHVKGLELIVSVPFAFGSCSVAHHAVKGLN